LCVLDAALSTQGIPHVMQPDTQDRNDWDHTLNVSLMGGGVADTQNAPGQREQLSFVDPEGREAKGTGPKPCLLRPGLKPSSAPRAG
jgi:hypothetical protein